MKFEHFVLPISLRKELSKPFGKLIKGSVHDTLPQLIIELSGKNQIIVAVGDVTTEILVSNNLKPDIILTDGYTKREKLINWKSYDNYKEIETTCPAAQITVDAWKKIHLAVKRALQNQSTHIKVIGEEDILVLPLIMELPQNSMVIYGQPNDGVVVVHVNQDSIKRAKNFLNKMDKYQE